MSSTQSGEGEIRKAMVEADAVDAMVALPGQLFFGTPIPACLWILAKDKSNGRAAGQDLRDRRGEVLFIDARKMGALVPGSRKQKQLSEDEIGKIAAAYHAWRGEAGQDAYADEPGFCKSATQEDIARHNYILTPGRYVGSGSRAEDEEPFDEKFERLMGELETQFAEGDRLEAVIKARLGALG
jgi:type I restriction enzyme M protein